MVYKNDWNYINKYNIKMVGNYINNNDTTIINFRYLFICSYEITYVFTYCYIHWMKVLTYIVSSINDLGIAAK